MGQLLGIQVPETANNQELAKFVERVYQATDKNYTEAARLMGVNGTTVRNLILGYQWDSPNIRLSLGINKTKPRPRVWMPTNNCAAAIKKLLKNYDKRDVYESLIHVVEQEDNVYLKVEEIKYNPRFWPK
jgi:hypothetical protein